MPMEKEKYLFNKKDMAKVFRACLPAALNEYGLSIPKNVPKQWVVDCAHKGFRRVRDYEFVHTNAKKTAIAGTINSASCYTTA